MVEERTEIITYSIYTAKFHEFKISAAAMQRLKDGKDFKKKLFKKIYETVKLLDSTVNALPAAHTKEPDVKEIYSAIVGEAPHFEINGDLLVYIGV